MRIELAHLRIPFKMSFSHASATRSVSDNVLVRITDQAPLVQGLGECCPRPYVSGETAATVRDFLKSENFADFWRLNSVEDILAYESRYKNLLDRNTAALCAAESALLDYLARQRKLSVEELLTGHPPEPRLESVQPTMVLGLESIPRFHRKVLKYWAMGFRHFKIKITADADFLRKLHQLLSSPLASFVRGFDGSFRLDGNNCFAKADEVLQAFRKFQGLIVGLEEPLRKDRLWERKLLLNHSELPLILDDSFVLLEDLQEALTFSRTRKILPNIRISKNGGLLRAQRLVRFCEEQKISYILGSQVGETSLLTRVGLSLISLAGSSCPRFYEGAFSDHLLSVDPFNPVLKLAWRGKIKNVRKVLKQEGWGLQPGDLREFHHGT